MSKGKRLFAWVEREIFWSVLDSNGMLVVQYWYDAWGNHKVCDVSGNEITDTMHIGHMNAYRYRGYYYDRETGLYYLNTRYYDPETGRFINRNISQWNPIEINGLNSYSYGKNNPVVKRYFSNNCNVPTALQAEEKSDEPKKPNIKKGFSGFYRGVPVFGFENTFLSSFS